MTDPAKIQSHLPAALLFLVIILIQNISFGQTTYFLNATCVDKPAGFLKNEIGLQTEFTTRPGCIDYVNKLPSLLQAKGFVNASLDSIFFDTASAHLVIYLGQQYKWAHINTIGADPGILSISGWKEKTFADKPINFDQLKGFRKECLFILRTTAIPLQKSFLTASAWLTIV